MTDSYDSQQHVAIGGAWQRAGMRLFRRLQISAEADVLDVGCGRGELTILLARCALQGRTIGIDANAQALEAARAQAQAAGLSNVTFVQGDVLSWEAPHGFDIVFSNSTLHLTRPGVAAAVRLAGWVRTGGTLAIQLPARDLPDALEPAIAAGLAAAKHSNPFPIWSSPWYLPTATELTGLLRESGLDDVRAMEELEPVTFRTAADAGLYFKGLLLGPYLEQLPADRHAAFLEAFGAALPTAGGLPQCTLRRMYVLGRKGGTLF
jgi:trans-aconitate methyltransferase